MRIRVLTLGFVVAALIVLEIAPAVATPAAGQSLNFAEIKVTYSGVLDKPTVQGIALLRGDPDARQGDLDFYLRRLAPNANYRLTINRHGCSYMAPGAQRVIGVTFTSDAEGEAFETLSSAAIRHEAGHAPTTVSIYEGWTGSDRRACQVGRWYELDNGGSNGVWMDIDRTAQVHGLYTGFHVSGTAKDAIYLDLPAAGEQYRVTINEHGCATNAPNQDKVRQITFISDQYGEIFQPYTALVQNQVIDGVFSLSVYDGWTGKDRISCRNGSFFDVFIK